MVLRVDLGLFAHDAGPGIAAVMAALGAQDAFANGSLDLQVHVLAHDCTDDTAAQAQWAAPARFRVHDLPGTGRAQTWNRFVHDLARREADILVFCDAAVGLPEGDCLTRLVADLAARPDVHLLLSWPVADTRQGTLAQRLAAATPPDAGATFDGQLYAMRAAAARRNILPIGLPAAEAFLRDMVLTDRFTDAGNPARIGGVEGLFHIAPSHPSLGGLIRYRTRLVVGAAINTAVTRHLDIEGVVRLAREISRGAADETWLPGVLRLRLPRLPYAYVPFRFLLTRRSWRHPGRALLGLGLDVIVYLNAQIRMARGAGVGYW
jgi:hypothetical protein